MNRSAIRELAFRLIYSREIQKEENIQEQIELFLEANEVKDEFLKKLMSRIALQLGISKEPEYIDAGLY